MIHGKLSDGTEIPCIGIGTWKSPIESVRAAIEYALEVGYRHIDCAYLYSNESEVGAALKSKLPKLGLHREDVYITSKLWNTHHDPRLVAENCRESLKDLGLDYLDLYLIHWPVSYQSGNNLFPKDVDGNTLYEFVSLEDTWKAMEKLVDKGLTKSIGLSNFNRSQISRILKICRIKPVMLQVEIHVDFLNEKLVSFAKSNGLNITAYSPLGAPSGLPDEDNLLARHAVCEIAAKHNKTAAQVLIRHAIERGIIPIPKSVTPSRIKENFEVFDFSLSEEEIQQLNSCSRGKRKVQPQLMQKHPEYPFNDEF